MRGGMKSLTIPHFASLSLTSSLVSLISFIVSKGFKFSVISSKFYVKTNNLDVFVGFGADFAFWMGISVIFWINRSLLVCFASFLSNINGNAVTILNFVCDCLEAIIWILMAIFAILDYMYFTTTSSNIPASDVRLLYDKWDAVTFTIKTQTVSVLGAKLLIVDIGWQLLYIFPCVIIFFAWIFRKLLVRKNYQTCQAETFPSRLLSSLSLTSSNIQLPRKYNILMVFLLLLSTFYLTLSNLTGHITSQTSMLRWNSLAMLLVDFSSTYTPTVHHDTASMSKLLDIASETPDLSIIDDEVRNVLIIVLESTRSDISFNNELSPFFDAISSAGISMRNMRTSLPNTNKSLFQIMCGTMPSLAVDWLEYENWKLLRSVCLPYLLKKDRFHSSFVTSSSIGVLDRLGFDSVIGLNDASLKKPNKEKFDLSWLSPLFVPTLTDAVDVYNGIVQDHIRDSNKLIAFARKILKDCDDIKPCRSGKSCSIEAKASLLDYLSRINSTESYYLRQKIRLSQNLNEVVDPVMLQLLPKGENCAACNDRCSVALKRTLKLEKWALSYLRHVNSNCSFNDDIITSMKKQFTSNRHRPTLMTTSGPAFYQYPHRASQRVNEYGRDDLVTVEVVTSLIKHINDDLKKNAMVATLTCNVHSPYFLPIGVPAVPSISRTYGMTSQHGYEDADNYVQLVKRQDNYIAQVFASLDEKDLLRNTLVIIVGDHGESFRAHGSTHHGNSIYSEQVHIPGLVIGPNVPQLETWELFRLVDIKSTIFDWFLSTKTRHLPALGNKDIQQKSFLKGSSILSAKSIRLDRTKQISSRWMPKSVNFQSPLWLQSPQGCIVSRSHYGLQQIAVECIDGFKIILHMPSINKIEKMQIFDLYSDPNETNPILPDNSLHFISMLNNPTSEKILSGKASMSDKLKKSYQMAVMWISCISELHSYTKTLNSTAFQGIGHSSTRETYIAMIEQFNKIEQHSIDSIRDTLNKLDQITTSCH